jgi:predicted outer membrane repeat protein
MTRLSLRARALFRLLILAFAALAMPVHAATITVNTFNQIAVGQCTIATAIASINAAADQPGCTHTGTYGTSDAITLASGGYALTLADNGTNAYPVIQKALTINGNGATLTRTVGAVAPFFRFFEVEAGSLTLNNATLTGGNLPNGNGGAIFTDSGPLVVSGSIFSNNTTPNGDGGAIFHNSTEAATISNSTFTGNSAPGGDGGAIYDNSTNGMTLTDVTFTSNSAAGGDGGAVFDNSTGGLTITNGTFSGNSASAGDGGAIYDNSSNGLVFNGGSVSNNSVGPGGDGGGIYDNSTGGINITNVVFTGNTATGGDGGGIFDGSSAGTGPVSNNCFVGNTATIGGGGIFRSSTPSLNAINNWWGAANGPSGAGPGTGDAVSTNVTFAPFLTTAPAICGGGPPSPGTLQFSLANYSVGEGAGSATIVVTRVGGSAGAVGVTFATSDGTATAGSDYTTAGGTLSWADGDTATKTFVVTIIDDTVVEGNETVNLTLSNPTGGATLGAQATAILTIIDDDGAIPPPTPVPTLSQWTLGLMLLLLLALGTWSVRRRR